MPDQSLPPNTIKPRSKKASKNHVVIREPQRPVHKSHVAPYPQPDYQPRIQPALPPTMGQSAMPSDAFAAEFRETLQMMQLKIQKLETLVDLKDKHIAKLTRSG